MAKEGEGTPGSQSDSSPGERLESWKEIAGYLKREVRTVQRWEKNEGLPIHRHEHDKLATVYAYKSELDAWWRNRVPQPDEDNKAFVVAVPARPPETESAPDANHDQAPEPSFWRQAAPFVLAVALVALGVFLWRQYRHPSPPSGKVMLAVLPFENLNHDPQQDFFSDGLTEEMITQLGRLHPDRLGVIARTSAMQYKATPKTTRQIGQELGVDYLLEGGVFRADNRVRITAQLIQVKDQTPLWADSYERNLEDVLSLQRDVAQAIADEIRVSLPPDVRARLSSPRPVDAQAYEAYLKGRYYWSKRGGEGLEKAIDYFHQAIQRDPNYAAAYAGLADSYALLGSVPYDGLPPRQAMPQAEAAAQRALQLDESLAEAHVSLAYAKMGYDWDWPGAEREFRRAIELNPGYATAHQWYALFLAVMGRQGEAMAEIKVAEQTDPLSLVIHVTHAQILIFARQYDQALEQCRQTFELEPNYVLGLFYQGQAYEQKGMYPEAIAALQKAKELSGGNAGMVTSLGYAEAVAGRRGDAEKQLEELRAIAQKKYVPALYFAAVYAGLGDRDQVFKWADKAYNDRSDYLVYLARDPIADSFRSDPRFKRLMRSMGLPP